MCGRIFGCLIIAVSAIKFSLNNVCLVKYVLIFQMNRHMSLVHLGMVVRNFLLTAGYYQFFRDHLQSNEVVVLDEGFVHRVVSLYVSASENADPEVVENYLKLLPQVDIVIFVKAPLDICLERIVRRRLPWRLQGLAAAAIARALANMAGAIEIVASHLSRQGCVTMIEADNARNLKACVAGLNDRVINAVLGNWGLSYSLGGRRLGIGYRSYAT
jgi:hypothetical protein